METLKKFTSPESSMKKLLKGCDPPKQRSQPKKKTWLRIVRISNLSLHSMKSIESKIGKIPINILVKILNEHQKITAKEVKNILASKERDLEWGSASQGRVSLLFYNTIWLIKLGICVYFGNY